MEHDVFLPDDGCELQGGEQGSEKNTDQVEGDANMAEAGTVPVVFAWYGGLEGIRKKETQEADGLTFEKVPDTSRYISRARAKAKSAPAVRMYRGKS